MAKPQTEDGFAMLALELLAALAVSDFPKYEKMILSLLIAAQYGPEKLPGYYLDHIEIGRITCTDRSCFRRSILSLVACGVIADDGAGLFSLVKDWERWIRHPGQSHADPFNHRVTPGDRNFVSFVAGRFAARNGSKHPRSRRPKDRSDRQATEAIQPPNDPRAEAIQPPRGPSGGAGQPTTSTDATDEQSPQSVPPQGVTSGLAGACVAASEELREIERREIPVESVQSDSIGIREADPDPARALASIEETVLRLTDDKDLTAAFMDQVPDWSGRGLTVADIRQALVVAREENVRPGSYTQFVYKVACSRRDRRLKDERGAAPLSGNAPVVGTLPGRPSYADRVAAERKATLDKIAAWKEQRAREVRDGNGV